MFYESFMNRSVGFNRFIANTINNINDKTIMSYLVLINTSDETFSLHAVTREIITQFLMIM